MGRGRRGFSDTFGPRQSARRGYFVRPQRIIYPGSYVTRSRQGGCMANLTGGSEFIQQPLRWYRWRKFRRQSAASASTNGLRYGLALILLPALLFVAIEIYRAVSIVPAIHESQDRVARSFEIITTAHSLDQAVQDAERGQRGYLITGDEEYLKPYYAGLQKIPEKLQELRRLTRDSADEQPHLEALDAQIKIKLAELKKAIALRRQEGFDAARRVVSTNVGANAMSEITGQLEAIITTENRALDQRQAAFFNVMRINELTGALAAALAFLVILIGGMMLWRAYQRLLRSQASLRRSEEQLRLLVTGVRDHALFMLDPAGNVASWNDGAERLSGYRADEIMGGNFSWFFPPEEITAGAPHQLLEVAATAGSAQEEGWRVRKDGSRYWASIVITALRDPSGELRGFAKVVRDITEQRRQQDTLDQNRAALAQLQKMEAIGQLTGGVAHDFNNLLQSILGSIELLQRPAGLSDPIRASRLLDMARRAGERGAALTHRLLAFARRQPLAPQVVDVNKLVGSMSELLHRTLGETIEVETVAAAGLWRTQVDPNQLESAILNLAVNARDAMPRGGKLTIETGNTWLDERYAATHAEVVPGQYVLIAISDSGEGMSEETLAHVFEPFFTTKPEGRGTGLGLAQVHGFVKQSGRPHQALQRARSRNHGQDLPAALHASGRASGSVRPCGSEPTPRSGERAAGRR